MNIQNKKPFFKKKILIEGSVLLLIGPLGTFFARLSNPISFMAVSTTIKLLKSKFDKELSLNNLAINKIECIL